jgi:hypothetical protein
VEDLLGLVELVGALGGDLLDLVDLSRELLFAGVGLLGRGLVVRIWTAGRAWLLELDCWAEAWLLELDCWVMRRD